MTCASAVAPTDLNKSLSTERSYWWLAFTIVVLVTAATRFYNVTKPDHVCWDETHFGKMSSWYINRTYFFDVHPPLGKMLIALSGYLTGYDGTFPFEKPGDKYNGTNYAGMRYFCTTLGALIVPIAFDTVYDMSGSVGAALVSSSYLIFDIGMLTLNRYILLDPILLFFMVASVWVMVKVSMVTRAGLSYTPKWWSYLFLTGSMLACTISVKFVGVFVVFLVGIYTVYELWTMLGNVQTPLMETYKQLVCRSIALIVWPVFLYVAFFYIHLVVLNRSGHGDGFYSSGFQSHLIGNTLHNASLPKDLAYGSLVTIKNHKTGGGYLHSHSHLYPKGSGARQQQITSYTHKDDNNIWIIKPHDKESIAELRRVMHGDMIRLEHLKTGRNLHSHDESAPLSKTHMQVTGYGEKGAGDANDIWKIFIVGGSSTDVVATVATKFILVHNLQGCVLTTTGKQLPKWGFEQQEVTCNSKIRDSNNKWNIEFNSHPQLQNEKLSLYKPGFVARFIEGHSVMFQGNAGLKPKEGEWTSRPWQWPINYKGQFFSGNESRIYLLGNPVIWWSNLVVLTMFVIAFIANVIRKRRQNCKLRLNKALQSEIFNGNMSTKLDESSRIADQADSAYESCGLWLFIGWALHYLPFWTMARVLYFHHYFPALIFNSMLSGVMLYHFSMRLARWLQYLLMAAIFVALAYSFKLFAPLAYGMNGSLATFPNSTMHGLKWLTSWDF